MQFPSVFIHMNQWATNSHSNCMKTLLSPCMIWMLKKADIFGPTRYLPVYINAVCVCIFLIFATALVSVFQRILNKEFKNRVFLGRICPHFEISFLKYFKMWVPHVPSCILILLINSHWDDKPFTYSQGESFTYSWKLIW